MRRLLAPATLLAVALPLLAQQGAIAYKHFHRYPTSGQWSTVGSATIDGKPMGAPVSSTTCASPLSPSRQAALMQLGNSAAPQCKINILRDEERLAQSEQVCSVPEQTIRTTLRSVDDQTISIETDSVVGQHHTVLHSTARYLGPCTAAQAAEAEAANNAPLPSMKPSKEECAEVASDRQQAEEGLKGCDAADLPEDMRPRCRTQMQALLKSVAQVERSCKQ